MSELAPASPWKAMVLLATPLLPRPLSLRVVRPFAISSVPRNARRLPIVGGLFRPPDHPRQSSGDWAPKSEKPRNIRHLRRSAARARGRDRILLTALRACYSNVRIFGRFGSALW